MAKIMYSALVNRISGRISHSVLSNWKGKGVIKRHNASIHQPHSAAQQAIRGLFSDLAGEYYSLTSIQKELWQSYVSVLADRMTPLNAYVGMNQIKQKYLPGSARLSTPPSTPSTPAHIVGFTVSALAASDFSIGWTTPVAATAVIVADYWPMPGFDNTIAPRFVFGVSATPAGLSVALCTTYPVGTVIKFRVRTIDLFGRTSPWSNMLSVAAIT